jgi:hypothetical protein
LNAKNVHLASTKTAFALKTALTVDQDNQLKQQQQDLVTIVQKGGMPMLLHNSLVTNVQRESMLQV